MTHRFSRPPPARVVCGPVSLEVHGPERAAEIADAINESLDHLRPWMAWAQRPTTVQEQAMRLAMGIEQSERGGDWAFTVVDVATGEVAGGCGLHARGAEGSLDIGYWLHPRSTGRGYASHAAAALTHLGFEALSAVVMRITCDEANVASAAIPARLGYVHVDTVDEAAETGRGRVATMVWELAVEDWPASRAATFTVSYDL